MTPGVVGSWYGHVDETEAEVLATFRPVLRAPILTAEHATQVLDRVAGRYPVLLLVETENDLLVESLPAVAEGSYGIELGNELNFGESAWPFGAFVRRSAATLRAGGYAGHIISGGMGNLEPRTLAWLRWAMHGWPPDVIVGWHAYSQWPAHLADFLALIGRRRHAMTEWGYTVDEWPEPEIAAMATRDLETFRESGAITAVWYQIADPPDAPAFGLHTADWRWRETLNALKGTPGAPLPGAD